MTQKYTTELSNSYSFNNLQHMPLPEFNVSRKRGSSQRMPTPSHPPAGYHSSCLVMCWFIFVTYVKLDH